MEFRARMNDLEELVALQEKVNEKIIEMLKKESPLIKKHIEEYGNWEMEIGDEYFNRMAVALEEGTGLLLHEAVQHTYKDLVIWLFNETLSDVVIVENKDSTTDVVPVADDTLPF